MTDDREQMTEDRAQRWEVAMRPPARRACAPEGSRKKLKVISYWLLVSGVGPSVATRPLTANGGQFDRKRNSKKANND